jgi:hypothetical protein
MPLINVFLWTILVLTVLLGYQVMLSYHKAEVHSDRQIARNNRTAMAENIRMQTCNLIREPSERKISRPSASDGFLIVGRQCAYPASVQYDYLLPSGNKSTGLLSVKEKAADSDCQFCA